MIGSVGSVGSKAAARIFAAALATFASACAANGSGSGGGPSGSGGAHPKDGGSGTTGAGPTGGAGAGNAGSLGSGNATGEAGTGFGPGAGGATGAAGVTGAAGTSGNTETCINGATMAPVSKLITDFSDAVADPSSPGQFKFGGGSPSEVQGGTAEFADTTETTPTLALVDGALSVTATSKGSYAGVVLYMNGPACVDGSHYTGVQFDFSGDLGTCNLTFGYGFADDQTAASDSARGICTATNCYPPSVAITTTGTIKEPYTAVTGGSPLMSVDEQKLTGVQWQLQSPATGTTCTATFRLDNVTFY
jgi:hypothetical protein